MKFPSLSVCLLVFSGTAIWFAAVSPVDAAITVVGTRTGSTTAPPDLAGRGTVLQALDFGSSTPFSYEGVTFAGANTKGSMSLTEATTPFKVTLSSNSGNIGSINLGSGAYSNLFETILYSYDNGATLTLTISGLKASSTYEFQFLNGDSRTPGTNTYSALQTFTDSISNERASTLLTYNTSSADSYANLIVDASGITSFTYTAATGNTRAASFAGLVVAEVPEPATWLASLGSIGLFGTILRCRRRACRPS